MEQQPNSPPDLETVARLRECLLNVRSRVDPLLRGKERTSRAELCEILPLPEVCCYCFGGIMVCWGEETTFNSLILWMVARPIPLKDIVTACSMYEVVSK